jgi:uncharacterized protein YjdB
LFNRKSLGSFGILASSALVLAACNDSSGPPPNAAADVTVVLTAPPATVFPGTVLRATATPVGAQSGATLTYSWSSANASVATVVGAGSTAEITAVSPGSTTVSVTAVASGSGLAIVTLPARSIPVNVTAPPAALSGTLSVAPTSIAIAPGAQQTLVPSVTRGGTAVDVQYSYRSNTPAVLSVSAAGAVTGVALGSGSVTVTATGTGQGFAPTTLTTEVPVRVSAPALDSLRIAPATLTLVRTTTAQLVPAVFGPGATGAVTYSYVSSAAATANVNATGLVTAVAPGTATITVTATGAGSATLIPASVTRTVAVTVRDGVTGVTITPRPTDLLLGTTTTLAATVQATGGLATTSTFQSSRTEVASVSAAGVVQAVSPGTTIIRAIATADPAVRDSITLRVTTVKLEAVSGATQSTIVGQPFTNPFVVRAVDESGRVVSNVALRFAVEDRRGSLSATEATTDASGLAQVRWTPGVQFDDVLRVSSVSSTAALTLTPEIYCQDPIAIQPGAPVSGTLSDDGAACVGNGFAFSIERYVPPSNGAAIRWSSSSIEGTAGIQIQAYGPSPDFASAFPVAFCELAAGQQCQYNMFALAPSFATGFYTYKPLGAPSSLSIVQPAVVPVDFAGCPSAPNFIVTSGTSQQQLAATDCVANGRPGDDIRPSLVRGERFTVTVASAAFAPRILAYRFINSQWQLISTANGTTSSPATLAVTSDGSISDYLFRIESQSATGGAYTYTGTYDMPGALRASVRRAPPSERPRPKRRN